MHMSQSGPPGPTPPEISGHELVRPIGRGSYGEVWLARNTTTGAYRAVKVVWRRNFEHDKPYEREFQGLRRFEPVSRSHDGLMDVLEVGRNDSEQLFYAVMELADDRRTGQQIDPVAYIPRTLRSEVQSRGRLPFEECLKLGISLAEALGQLHRHGLVHRDIKPSNIIFVEGVPKLADIGLVTNRDATLSFVGTEGYVPPEGPGTPQADLYALGKVLYEISTSRDRLDYPELPTGLKAFPDRAALLELNEVIVRACEPAPAARYRSAEDLLGDLQRLREGKSVRQERRLDQRRLAAKRIALVGLAAMLLAAGIGLVWLLSGPREPVLVEHKGSYVEVKSDLSHVLWATNLDAPLADNWQVEDLDGDGHKEVVLATSDKGIGTLWVLDHQGKCRWTYNGPTNPYYGRAGMMVSQFAILPGNFGPDRPKLAVSCRNSQGWFPASVAVLDCRGKQLGLFWHPGNIVRVWVRSETRTAKPKIIAWAINNNLRSEYHASPTNQLHCLFALDQARVSGEAPPYKGGGPRGTHEWYGVFLPAGQAPQQVDFLDVNGDGKMEICVSIAADKLCLTFDGHPAGYSRGDLSRGPVRFELLEQNGIAIPKPTTRQGINP